ncbi:actin cross-linking [Hysterangium stoloniferum]|nr:actin cross-linking [Hysterangium stoloniferum]
MDTLETRSRDVQERTFCKWLNTKLEMHNYPPMTSLVKDLSDGEIMGDVSLGRYNKNPRIRVQKAENVTMALDFIASRGVKLTNIGPEDIIDGNLKLILGMIWTLILRFTIADINEEGLSAKEGLLLWCQRKTELYDEVDVQDFSYSWSDGLALCALIHAHRPDLIDFISLDKSNKYANTQLAFSVAEKHLGIPQLLEVEDLCDAVKPDERSVMTYVASFFHAFSSQVIDALDQAETVSRRVVKFAELMQSVWTSQNDYEQRAQALLAALSSTQSQWAASSFTGSYADAKSHSAAFQEYKSSKKRQWVTERQDLVTLFGNVQTKLKTYGLREWKPQRGLDVAVGSGVMLQMSRRDLELAWKELLVSEARKSRSINAQIRNIKESLRHKFSDLANSFERHLQSISSEISALDGPLEVQQQQVQDIQKRLKPLEDGLADLLSVEDECRAANVEENDYTVFTYQDLAFELELVVQAISKKITFIDNQIVSRNMSNLTPAQLEQFESTFRYFDREKTNTLDVDEMAAALASLGIVYSDGDLDTIYSQLLDDYGAVTYEAFINLLVDIMEDQTSPEQLRDAFRGIANDKPFVTELDLRLALLPAGSIEYLREAMPRAGEELDYESWLDQPLSGVELSDGCVEKFQELKRGKKLKYIIYAISGDNKKIVVMNASDSSSYDDFLLELPSDDCRWAVYDFHFEKTGEGQRSKMSPDGAKVKTKMVYASSKDALRNALGISIEIQGTDTDEVEYESVLDKVSRGH